MKKREHMWKTWSNKLEDILDFYNMQDSIMSFDNSIITIGAEMSSMSVLWDNIIDE